MRPQYYYAYMKSRKIYTLPWGESFLFSEREIICCENENEDLIKSRIFNPNTRRVNRSIFPLSDTDSDGSVLGCEALCLEEFAEINSQ